MPLGPREQEAIDRVRDGVWKYYQRMRAYRQSPTPRRRAGLERDFDRLFTQRTGFMDLNAALKRIHEKRADLLIAYADGTTSSLCATSCGKQPRRRSISPLVIAIYDNGWQPSRAR